MSELTLRPDPEYAYENMALLAQNEYPGRIAIMGVTSERSEIVQAYALMGRSAGSRNRIFIEHDGGIRTTAPDKTPEEMAEVEHAELIYYSAIRDKYGVHVVSNGAQTEHVLAAAIQGELPQDAIKKAPVVEGVDLSVYEPDNPNFTPRITGVVDLRDDALIPFALSVARKNPQNEEAIYDSFAVKALDDLDPGVGYAVQTYKSNAPNGEPLPSFDLEKPYTLPLEGSLEEVAHSIWSMLNINNRVAFVAKSIDIESGITTGYEIINTKD